MDLKIQDLKEIVTKHPDEWVSIIDCEYSPDSHYPLKGKVTAHSPHEEKFHHDVLKLGMELAKKSFIFNTAELSDPDLLEFISQ